MSDSDNVIFLSFKSSNLEEGERSFLSCKHCHNKTYRVVWQGEARFPMMECCACGAHIGRMGWAQDDEDEEAAS